MRRPRHQSDPKCLWAGIQEEVGIHPSKTQLAVELLKMKITFSFNVLKYLRVKHLPYCNCRGWAVNCTFETNHLTKERNITTHPRPHYCHCPGQLYTVFTRRDRAGERVRSGKNCSRSWNSYLGIWHPYWGSLLFLNQVCHFCVPVIRVKLQSTWNILLCNDLLNILMVWNIFLSFRDEIFLHDIYLSGRGPIISPVSGTAPTTSYWTYEPS